MSLIVIFCGDWCQKPVTRFMTQEIEIWVHKTLNWCYVLLIFDFVIFMDNSLTFFRFRAQGVKSLHNYRDY